VLDEDVDATKGWKSYQILWNEIIDEIESSDEVLEAEPERLHFRSPEETGVL
jgi:hypothetical protein